MAVPYGATGIGPVGEGIPVVDPKSSADALNIEGGYAIAMEFRFIVSSPSLSRNDWTT